MFYLSPKCRIHAIKVSGTSPPSLCRGWSRPACGVFTGALSMARFFPYSVCFDVYGLEAQVYNGCNLIQIYQKKRIFSMDSHEYIILRDIAA